MFDNNDQNQPAADATATPVAPTAPMPAGDPMAMPAVPMNTTMPVANPPADTVMDNSGFNMTPLDIDPVAAPAPSDEMPNMEVAATPEMPSAQPMDSMPAPEMPSATIEPTMTSPDAGGNDLLSIKQDALQNLSPLLSHLDQTPEEKFRTTMMLIQASDDQSLVQAAYAAAKDISDEKVRAQALLDIINEINYFTQQQKPTE